MREPTKTILVIDFTVVTQSYMPPTRLSTNGMRHPTVLPSRIAAPHFDQYSFPVPLRVGGWVGLGSWLRTEMVCPPENGHPCQY